MIFLIKTLIAMMKNYTISSIPRSSNTNPKKSFWFSRVKKSNYKFKLPPIKTILTIFAILLGVFLLAWFILAKIFIYRDLPDVSQVKNMVFSQSTIIQDRNWVELYKVFAENREYIDLSDVNQNMINAIVAIEDQRYREHSWLDPMWLLRAAIKKVLNPSSRMQWASTIPQQLVRNLLLTKDRKVQRKLKEMVLTKKLNWVIENRVSREQWRLNSVELKKEMKNKTLELYLNYISFGNNAYWIQSASKTYFGIPAKDLNILQSSILASLPKWPSLYDPHKNKDLLMWRLDVSDAYGNQVSLEQSFAEESTTTWDATRNTNTLKYQIISKFQQWFANTDFSNKKDANSILKFIDWLWSFTIFYNWQEYTIKYKNWRKDLVLSRMFEDGYIWQEDLKTAFLQWLDFQFTRSSFPIKAPHFVQWIIEQLEQEYWKEVVTKWWLVVTTTLDYEIQQLAENALLENVLTIQNNWANNSSLIYIDSFSWDVLAYVWSINYFNDKIQWQNDMIRRPRQSGSSIKPFIYALWFEKLPLTLDTPIYDIPFQIWPDKPNNADDKFEWLLPLKHALWYSRNIPATKMFLWLWWETVAIPFLNNLWLKWVNPQISYWYTLALWAAEVSMLDLATAYSHLTMAWKPAEISPILEVKSSDWSILYQKSIKYRDEVIKPWIVYLLRNILSDPANRLAGWVNKFNVKWLAYALKTWTSNVKTDSWNRPRDWWMAAYTPSKVLLLWAWNADASPMNRNAYGWTIHADPTKKFLWALLAKWYIQNEEMPRLEVASATISKISGKLAGEATPSEFTVNTIWYIKNMPSMIDEWAVSMQYDSSCNGKISPYTPIEQVQNWFVITPFTFMPNQMDLEDIINRWKWSTQLTWDNPFSWKVVYNYKNIFIQPLEEFCPWRTAIEDTDIQVNIVKPLTDAKISPKWSIRFDINSPKDIKTVNVLVDQSLVGSFNYPSWRKVISDIKPIDIKDIKDGKHTLQLIAIDNKWFSNSQTIQINISSLDKQAPFLVEDKAIVKINDDSTYTVMFLFDDELSAIQWWKFTNSSWEVISEFKNNFASFQVAWLSVVSLEVKDSYWNILSQNIDLNNYLK